MKKATSSEEKDVSSTAKGSNDSAPQGPPETRGIVDEKKIEPAERPQADPEMPELGEWDKRRGQQPSKDATGF